MPDYEAGYKTVLQGECRLPASYYRPRQQDSWVAAVVVALVMALLDLRHFEEFLQKKRKVQTISGLFYFETQLV